MRDYLKYLVLFTTVFSLLVSCQKRVDLSVPTKTPVNDEKGEATLSFTASFDDLTTLLKAYPTEVEAPQYRLSFNGIRAVLYTLGAETREPKEVAYAFDWDVTATKGKVTGRDLLAYESEEGQHRFVLKGEKNIQMADYKLFLFATPSKQLKEATKVGMPFSELKKSIDISDLAADRRVFTYGLYSTKNPIEITETALAETGPNRHFLVDNTALTADNALASVTWEPTVVSPEFAIYDKAIFLLSDVLNKNLLLYPENDAALASLDLFYPIDANYQGYAEKSLDELQDDFLYVVDNPTKLNAGFHVSSLNGSNGNNPDSYIVLPENTVASNEAVGKVTTRIIVQAIIFPKSIAPVASLGLANGALNYTWVLFKGQPYPFKQFADLYNATAVKEVSKQTVEDKEVLLAGKSIIDHYNEYATPKLPYDKLEIKDLPNIAGFKTDLISYYHKGRNYFSIPIRHYSDQQVSDRKLPGRYGVVRGYYYQIHISKFQRYGEPSFVELSRDVDYNNFFNLYDPKITFQDFQTISTTIEL